jgi:hypothetical protein
VHVSSSYKEVLVLLRAEKAYVLIEESRENCEQKQNAPQLFGDCRRPLPLLHRSSAVQFPRMTQGLFRGLV